MQQGKIGFKELYKKLLNYYLDSKNQWADYYVLPDFPPTSDDSPPLADLKVKETIIASKLLFSALPEMLKERAIGVVHGKNFEQVQFSLKSYGELGLEYLGFGSFSTNGKNNSINILDSSSLKILKHVCSYAKERGVKLHIFGVSTPPAIYIFNKLGVYSFDSSAWLRSAGYGKIFMPFTRAYNITYRTIRNSALSSYDLQVLKEITNHECPFCNDVRELSKNRWYRILHNLIVLHETVEMLKTLLNDEILNIIRFKSQKYYKLAKEISQM